ncbi:MAG: FTR1 family protein [Desulfurococcales archaeon]|nr:FTR1 family protein [Desulfurococcales archaeon]
MSGVALGSLVIALREVLEASLILAIILTTLSKTGRSDMRKYVVMGLAGSVTLGLATGYTVWYLYGSFPKKELFEAIASLTAAAVLTWVIYWMAKTGPQLAWNITRKVSLITSGIGLVVFTFIVTYREALETVLFLVPYMLSKPLDTVAGALAGGIMAVGIAYMIYIAGYRISLRRFFMLTSILLTFVASGILGYGIHELAEVMEEDGIYTGVLLEEAYNLGISEGSLLHNNGLVGSILAVMFGYSVSMEWIRLIIQLGYLAILIPLILRAYGYRIGVKQASQGHQG